MGNTTTDLDNGEPAPPRRERSWLRRLLTVAAVLVALVVLGAGALLVRLSRGPLSLDFLTPYVIEALEPADGSLRVTIGATELVWTERWYDVDLNVRDVACKDVAGTTIASLDSLAMELSVRALLRGVVAPSEIELARPQIVLVREPDGGIDFGLGRGASPAGGESLLDRLFGTGDADRGAAPAAQYLRHVVVRDGQLALVDQRTGFRSDAEAVAVEVTRATDRLDVDATTAIALGDQRIPIKVVAGRTTGEGGTQIRLVFSDLDPAAALDAANVLNPEPGTVAASILETAAYLQLPLAGTIDVDLDQADALRKVTLDGSAAKGEIVLPAPLDQRLAIERVALAATYVAATDTAELTDLEIDLGIPELRLTGRWSGSEAGALTVDATISNLPSGDLERYWPAPAAVAARTWVTSNISGGAVKDAAVTLRGTLVPDRAPAFDLRELTGRLTFAGLAVRYLDTMPPATGVGGKATFSTDGFDFQVGSGKVAGLTVPSARVVISGLPAKVTRIAIDAQARGSIRDALTLVDAEPLNYAHKIGIDPKVVAGTMTGRVKLAFPLAGAPIPPDLGVGVDAQLSDAAFPNAVGDWALSAGNLTLGVGGDALSITGSARVAGVTCDVRWHENLTAKSGVSRTIDVRSSVDADGRKALGFDLQPWVTGPSAVTAHVEQHAGGKGTATLAVDLTDAALEAPALRLVKQPGQPSRADFTLALDGSKVTAANPFSFDAPGASAQGKATFGTGGARIANLSLEGILPPVAPGDPSPQFALTLAPAAQGNRFELTSNDASTLMLLLLPDSKTVGGGLTFRGQVELEATGLPFSGDLVVRSFRLTKSPVMARLLQLSSLSGIQSTFAGEGLSFDSLTAGIGYGADEVTFTDGVADGPSVRLVFSGKIDGASSNVAIDGTLVPSFYGLNTAVARVPLIGGLFTGTDGEGVIAIDFTVRGAPADPRISVKPLSSIAPGVLRSLARRMPW